MNARRPRKSQEQAAGLKRSLEYTRRVQEWVDQHQNATKEERMRACDYILREVMRLGP